MSILDMNSRYQLLVDRLEEWSHDASPVVSCEALLFDDFPPSDDQITRALAIPSELDSTVQEIFQVLFCAYSTLLRRLVEDHLPPSVSGDQISSNYYGRSRMPLEGLILFSNNKTAKKSPEEKEEFFRKARRLATEFKRMYAFRREQLLEDRAQVLKEKQLALQKLQEKRLREKEKITDDIMVYGLWQTEVQITVGLEKFRTNADKLKALKCQLDFRKKVLEEENLSQMDGQ